MQLSWISPVQILAIVGVGAVLFVVRSYLVRGARSLQNDVSDGMRNVTPPDRRVDDLSRRVEQLESRIRKLERDR